MESKTYFRTFNTHNIQDYSMRIILLSVFLWLLSAIPGKAQFIDYGQDPAFLRWRQINTNNFQLIYPDYFESNAQKIANIYSTLYRHSNSLGHKPQKISVIIHPNGGIANGSVTWAPKRTDLYTVPQQAPSDTWLEHLCVHEFRHVVQIDKVNQGLTKILYYIFGEQLTIAVAGVYLPRWFMEGDAVTFETAVGRIGRGRSPEFLNEMKAQIVEKGIYTYNKATLGSLKSYVPNRYNFGYFMVANSRVNYGNEIWQNAITRIGRRPYGISPFARSLRLTMNEKRDSLWNDTTFRSLFINADSVKKKNGQYGPKKTLYLDNFSELQQIWLKELKDVKNDFDTIPTHNKYYTGYYYPTPTTGGEMIAYKKGLRQTGAFVSLKNGKEKTLTRTGILYDEKFAWGSGKIAWTEYRANPRWENGGRIVLTSYDLKHKKYRYHKSKYNRFSPFAAGSNWGVVEVDNNNNASIVILDGEMNKELMRIQAGPDELFIHPRYKDNQIQVVVQSNSGNHLESIDIQSGKRTKLTDPFRYELDNPVKLNNQLLFRASFNGNNSLYSLGNKNKEISNILNSRFGLRFPATNTTEDTLYFSFYTSNGYKPGKIEINRLTSQPMETATFRLADSLTRSENWELNLNADSTFPTKKYNKLTHALNIHSWGPLYINQFDRELDAGLILYSQNKLSTLSLTAGYIFNSDYKNGAWLLNATYKGLWPVFSLDFKSGKDNYYITDLDAADLNTGKTETLIIKSRANYTQGEVTMKLPFNLSVKNYNRSISPYVRYKIAAIHNYTPKQAYAYKAATDSTYHIVPVSPDRYRFSTPVTYYQVMEYGITFSNQTRMTEQELNPRWGQVIQAGFANTPWKKIDLGKEWWVAGYFYFPGLFANHSLSVYTSHQKRPQDRYYDKKIQSPRGITLYGDNLTTLRTTYEFPILYPDQNLTSLLYLKAINGGVFFDMSHDKWTGSYKNNYSYGIELSGACHLIHLPFPINIGIRTGYETQKKSMFANMLFSVGLNI